MDAAVTVLDGREDFSNRKKAADGAMAQMIEREVRTRAKEPFLRKRLDGLAGGGPGEFAVRDESKGAFTRPNAVQKAVLYRYSYTNGVVILQDGRVVAHYSGDPGDYALYMACARVPDLDGDGLDELALVSNVEDGSELYGDFFKLGGAKASYLGRAPIFSSNALAGEESPAPEALESTAYCLAEASSKLYSLEFRKVGDGAWISHGSRRDLILDHSRDQQLTRIDKGAPAP